MEFNPLDLLASAAELQQKQDDGPSITMVTRRRNNSASAKPSVAEQCPSQKENAEVVNNNNNNNSIKTTKGITIIKKIKISSSPEIEKMLNEHNYGNVKKGPRHEKNNGESGFDVNGRYQDCNTLSGNRPCTIEAKPSHIITTFGRSLDKVSVISNSGSQASDSECKCGEGSSGSPGGEGTSSHTVCKCRANPGGDKITVQLTCSECMKVECDCRMPTGERKVDSQISDKTEGHLTDGPTVKQECENKQTDKTSTGDRSTGECPPDQHTDNSTHTCDMDTGPDSCETGELQNNFDHKIELESEKVELDNHEQNEITQSETDKKLEVIDEKTPSSDMVKCSVFTSDTMRIKPDSKTATSDRKKLPYVKVIPSKSNTELDTPQTLVINIAGKAQNNCKISQNILEHSSSLAETDRLKTETCEKRNTSESFVIKSMLATDKISTTVGGSGDTVKPVVSEIVSIKPRLDIPKCNTLDLTENSDSYESLKRLELSDSLCSDISSTSVHLLSPDRRNPDSMGIAESPVMTGPHELSGLSETDSECDKHKTDTNSDLVNSTALSSKSDVCSPDADKCVNLSPIRDQGCKEASSVSLKTESLNSEGSGDISKELVRDSRLTSGSEDKLDISDNSANDHSAGSGNDVPIFRFESDHCYAGLPRAGSCSQSSLENEEQSFSEREEVKTPMDSLGEISQDSGYEDVTHSPETERPLPVTPDIADPAAGMKTVKNLVPVLISVNNTGCLTLHSDPNISKQLGGQVLTVADNGTVDKGSLKLIPGTNLSTIPQSPLILSPVGNKSPVVLPKEPPPLVQTNAESILGLLRPTSPDPYISPTTSQEQTSPPKYGKFRIGTFASFSSTGMPGMDNPKSALPGKLSSPQVPGKLPASMSKPRTNGVKSPPAVVDTLGTLVQKVKSSLSPALNVDNRSTDHIQHDHDYCLKSLVPSLVSSVLEAKLQKEAAVKGKVPHGKIKKAETEMARQDGKMGKRKRSYSNISKEDFNDDCDLDEDSECYSNQPEFIRPKTRAEKYIEQKSAEPKVKITGSSTFQDQFVYFMNTKKRSRRRESRDTPIPLGPGGDRVFIPPKPGDIVVPHLSDQDIENLKKRSKLKVGAGAHALNSLRSEFMAAKLTNQPFSDPNKPSSEPVAAVDEKNIINTILSMENETLASPDEPYNESMEMYGQGLGSDIMNFLPEQMNLTQEQMDLLYSAVDEVQNSSPGLVSDEKLVSSEGSESAFSQFAIPDTYERRGSEASGGVDTTEEEETAAEKQEETTPAASPEKKQVEGEDSKEPEEAETPMETADSPVPSTPDTAESKTCSEPTPFLPPETKQLSGKPEVEVPSKPDDEFSVGEASSPTPTALDITPQSTASLQMITSTPNLSTKPSFVSSVSGSESSETSLKTSINPINITTSLSSVSSEMSMSSLPPLDRSSLDILGGEFRLDKTDLFPEPAAMTSSGPVDTSAPWIVTVSMYWNDLPAIMINNAPFVRLVDIHKQILPAKDTGILKKRCQLMGIDVENCSEMQRYFLVQYGRAFNSKSTLIVSKDNAKELIGYYVDPQPKASRMDDHKSIIDHRREQLRRIALARRAAIRARKGAGRKEEDDPRAIKDEADTEPLGLGGGMLPSVLEPVRPVETLTTVVPPITATPADPRASSSAVPKRATRQKKINFLEMLRGDSNSQAADDDGNNDQDEPKKGKLLRHQESTESNGSAKKGRTLKNKVKIVNVKYTIQSESSETESNYTESELSSSESTSGESEVVIVKKHGKHRLYPTAAEPKAKSKAKMNLLKKQQRPPLKVKISTGKRSKLLGGSGSAPVGVQVINKSLSPALPFYRSRLGSSDSRDSTSPMNLDTPSGSYQVYNKANGQSRLLTFGKSSETCSEDTNENSSDMPNSLSNFENNLYSRQNIPEFKKVIVEQINESDMKIPTTLPDEILEEESKTREMETNTDFDVPGTDYSEDRSLDTREVESNKCVPETSSSEPGHKVNIVNGIGGNGASLPHVNSAEVKTRTERSYSSESLELVTNEDSCQSLEGTDGPLLIMKRKEREQINVNEAPLRILHRESSPLNVNRSRSQLGELFIEKYMTKKSPCIQCYTCRKMMSVDNFMRHLHDIVTGGLLVVDTPRTIDACNTNMTDMDRKVWEAFQRKKELFDNNQLPSPDIQEGIFGVDSDSNHSLPDNVVNIGGKSIGPRVITTPVSPMMKKGKPVTHARHTPVQLSVEPADGVRSSGRKRKKKQLYPFEEYTFAKFPRLHGVDNRKDSTSDSHQ